MCFLINYGRSILVSKKDVATLKLNALLVDMEHLFLWQTKAVLASMTILKPQNINKQLEVKLHLLNSKVTDYFCKPGTKSEDEVAAAEATMAIHTVKHHCSYKSNDCTSTLMAKIFPDSSTSKKFSCARTKIEAIVNNVLAPASV